MACVCFHVFEGVLCGGVYGLIHWEGLELAVAAAGSWPSVEKRSLGGGGTGLLLVWQQSSMALVRPRARRAG